MTHKHVLAFCAVSTAFLCGCARYGITLTHHQAVEILSRNGIAILSGMDCGGTRTSGCVSLDGIRHETVQGLIDLKNDIDGCRTLRIVGGTEEGHATGNIRSHSSGYKLDVSFAQGDCARLKSFVGTAIRHSNFANPSVTDRGGFITRRYRYVFNVEPDMVDLTIEENR